MAGHRKNHPSDCDQPLLVWFYRKRLWICNCGQVWKRTKCPYTLSRSWGKAGNVGVQSQDVPTHNHYEYASLEWARATEERILALEYPKKSKKRVQKGA